MVRAAIADDSMAIALVKQGLVFKLTTLIRQATLGPPPPLPPRDSIGSSSGAVGGGTEKQGVWLVEISKCFEVAPLPILCFWARFSP